ncbi:Uma2 family endonuclease [Aliterella atlantica]|uniref:Uma2 family endonuclease n=1 Tax=Aliterella atlantica TaxID=1827278 RepID=UPI000AD17B9A|nr:Uma2 family endonuclease [Aliterella atlantica]
MIFTSAEVNNIPIEELLPEKRVTFYNLSWRSYEQIIAALGDKRASRLTYYQGILEIVIPLEAHESASARIGILIHILAEELNLNIKSMASTTLNNPALKIGAEPDKCYYIQNEPAVRGKVVNLAADPPPDLVLEVDITHTDIDKNKLYQDMGVLEFWRYNGKTLTVYLLKEG